jgi:hypothetical protein
MKTKLLLVLALLASGCSPALDERYVKSVTQVRERCLALVDSCSPYAVRTFLEAVAQLTRLPMHDYWGYRRIVLV